MTNPNPVFFEPANTTSYRELNALSYRSRGVWKGTPGYVDGYLEQSRCLIDLDEEYIRKNIVWAGFTQTAGKREMFGFFGLKIRDDQERILDHFWIEPHLMNRGLG